MPSKDEKINTLFIAVRQALSEYKLQIIALTVFGFLRPLLAVVEVQIGLVVGKA